MIYVGHKLNDAQKERLSIEAPQEVVHYEPLPSSATPQDEWPAELQEAEILLASGPRVTAELLSKLPKLRWVHVISAGVDMLPLERMRDLSIILTNSRGVHGIPMAEQIFGMMLSFSRSLHGYWANQQAGRWDRNHPLEELAGKRLLIVGAGSIGMALARRAKAFEMTVVGVKGRVVEALPDFDAVVGYEELDQELPSADYVVLLAPLTAKTRHLMNLSRLRSMKSTAVLINFGRGPLIDEGALIEALSEGAISGAGLDVFEEEPLDAKSPLWKMDNVLITPHTGGWTPAYEERMMTIFLDNLAAYRDHRRPLPTEVNLTLGY